ncbi:class C sortase [Periweissella cryptocerci]|uniref:Class C sortase n=1 Tax=Periweissella cryptocerci TaxID=2506420 RepID=A0A4P6YWV8_9LACO|nr:class C sortase [Periweissella cryptocerci]QBO37328.1 class C sortase [Periweissella cryptocerci]
MKQRIVNGSLILMLLLGLAILLYPFVGDSIANFRNKYEVQQYQKSVKFLKSASAEKNWREARKYNAVLYQQRHGIAVKQPVPYADILSFNKIMAILTIPKIGIKDEPIYHGVSMQVLARGLGHMAQTSIPIGGKSTHAAISGHSSASDEKVFAKLEQLKYGDNFYIGILGKTHKYRVNQIRSVLPNDVKNLEIQKDKDYVTLITCTPIGVNSHRLLIRGERVPMDGMEKSKFRPTILAIIAAVALLLVVILLLYLWWKRRKGREAHENIKNSI